MPVTQFVQAPMSEASVRRLIDKFTKAESKLKRNLRTVKNLLPPDSHDEFLITPHDTLNSTSQGAVAGPGLSIERSMVPSPEKQKARHPSEASVRTV